MEGRLCLPHRVTVRSQQVRQGTQKGPETAWDGSLLPRQVTKPEFMAVLFHVSREAGSLPRAGPTPSSSFHGAQLNERLWPRQTQAWGHGALGTVQTVRAERSQKALTLEGAAERTLKTRSLDNREDRRVYLAS